MSTGNNVPLMGYESVLALAPEVAFGTFVTGTSFCEFNTESLNHTRENIKIESINGLRDYTKVVKGNVTIDGSIEAPLNLGSDFFCQIFKQAMGGTCSSVVASGSSYTHTFAAGDMELNVGTAASEFKSVSLAIRPGAGWSTASDTWNFYGCRVNQLTLKCEPGAPVNWTAEIIGKGCSLSATIPTAAYSDLTPVMFTGVSISSGNTSSSQAVEYAKSFELTINNNLNTDHRVLGSAEVAQLPPVKRDVTLKITQVFDTISAYQKYIDLTQTYFIIGIDQEQRVASASTGTYKMVITLPNCKLSPNMPKVDGPGPIIQELEYTAYYASTQSYALLATVRNLTSSY